ncbi:sulfite exporter TauE/SafE family protein [Rhodopseudomonas boonkerdii]|uniref:sulfite exporter TauE/SafE family protein n=1 Tax=Rhodopseudomonas boonkerdii TaxID=475937 RepID=UPI001E43D034|nr:sulfite exporter TauE/SafE family protein [Rhodopseudomonas boonkerdii]UGV26823.1 sulfite exporter TauE/SafE family protein [Rhodopseudomonas boonkerdii]
MDAISASTLSAAGVIGGIVNAIAGGATLITFPAMIAVGLSPMIANASNAVAVVPGHLMAALADRSRWPNWDSLTQKAIAASACGGTLGALLLLASSDRIFVLLVPALVGIATLIFAFGRKIQERLNHHRATESEHIRPVLLFLAAIYGGYFGAGLGVMLLAVLTITGREDVRTANALKNVLATAVSFATITIFVIRNAVSWPETLIMLAGALIGGLLGGRLFAVLPAPIVRGAIVVIGGAMTVIYIWRYWL